jgi:transposase
MAGASLLPTQSPPLNATDPSQAVRGFGLRRSRYVGHAKAHLQHVATAAAINLVRMTEWLGGADLATTRRSKFRALMAKVA